MAAGDWIRDIDMRTPSPARMYDYYLGGNHNFAADRQAAEQVIAALPNVREIARANRAFLGAAVRHLLDLGVRQFLDIGSGIPTVGNVHDIAHGVDPSARVVYVDIDPVAVAHSVALLAADPFATAICGDVADPAAILADPAVRDLLEFDRPVGLLLVSMLQFVADDAAYPAVAHLVDAVAPGSFLVVSHGAVEALSPESTRRTTEVYSRSITSTSAPRDRTKILKFFHGLDLLPPGLVWVSQWAPGAIAPTGGDPATIALLGGVARKPAAST